MRSFSLAVLAAGAMAPAIAMAQPRPDGYWRHMYDGGWFPMMFGWFFLLALIVAAVVVANVLRGPRAASAGPTPLDILKQRFARGEIDKAEYDERRKVLGD